MRRPESKRRVFNRRLRANEGRTSRNFFPARLEREKDVIGTGFF